MSADGLFHATGICSSAMRKNHLYSHSCNYFLWFAFLLVTRCFVLLIHLFKHFYTLFLCFCCLHQDFLQYLTPLHFSQCIPFLFWSNLLYNVFIDCTVFLSVHQRLGLQLLLGNCQLWRNWSFPCFIFPWGLSTFSDIFFFINPSVCKLPPFHIWTIQH